jgi:hypothetical protein
VPRGPSARRGCAEDRANGPSYERLLADRPALQERLSQGEQHATQRADRVLARAMNAMGP